MVENASVFHSWFITYFVNFFPSPLQVRYYSLPISYTADMEMFGKKKGKKKKSKPFSMDDLNDALPETKEGTATENEEKDPALAEVDEFDLDINFSKAKKKKSKKRKDLDVLIAEQEEASMDADDKDVGESCSLSDWWELSRKLLLNSFLERVITWKYGSATTKKAQLKLDNVAYTFGNFDPYYRM